LNWLFSKELSNKTCAMMKKINSRKSLSFYIVLVLFLTAFSFNGYSQQTATKSAVSID